jgi:hypothetical protein
MDHAARVTSPGALVSDLGRSVQFYRDASSLGGLTFIGCRDASGIRILLAHPEPTGGSPVGCRHSSLRGPEDASSAGANRR